MCLFCCETHIIAQLAEIFYISEFIIQFNGVAGNLPLICSLSIHFVNIHLELIFLQFAMIKPSVSDVLVYHIRLPSAQPLYFFNCVVEFYQIRGSTNP